MSRKKLKYVPVVTALPEPVDPARKPGERRCRICGGTGKHDWNIRTKDDTCWACNGTGKGKLCKACGEVMPMCECVRKYSASNLEAHEKNKAAVEARRA